MIKRLKLAFVFLVACALVADFYGSGPPATAGGTDLGPRAAAASPPATGGGTDKNPPADAGGTDKHLRARGPTDAQFAAHVEQLKKKLPSEDFTIIVQKPFVVIGDEPADDVKAHSIRTVKWRSEEHTSELQSLAYLVCRLLLEKKKIRHT